MKVKLTKFNGLLLTVITVMTACPVVFSQAEKDIRQYEKLERDIRENWDKLISKSKQTADTPPPPIKLVDPRPSIQTSYDKFKDTTTVSIQSTLYRPVGNPRISNAGSLGGYLALVDVIAAYSFSGQRPSKPPSIILLLKSTFTTGTLFGRDPSFIVIADNRRIRVGNMTQTIEFVRNATREYLSVAIPIDVFNQIATATRVEAQVGNIDFVFLDENLRSFRLLLGISDPNRNEKDERIAPSTVAGGENLEDTAWGGSKLSATFRPAGLLAVNGVLSERTGAWEQSANRVRFELPFVSVTARRALGVGIMEGNKMVVKIKIIDLLGPLSTIETVLHRTP